MPIPDMNLVPVITSIISLLSLIGGGIGFYLKYRQDMRKLILDNESAKIKGEFDYEAAFQQALIVQQKQLQEAANRQIETYQKQVEQDRKAFTEQLATAQAEIKELKAEVDEVRDDRAMLTDVVDQLISVSRRIYQELRRVYVSLQKKNPEYLPAVNMDATEAELRELEQKYRQRKVRNRSP